MGVRRIKPWQTTTKTKTHLEEDYNIIKNIILSYSLKVISIILITK